MTTVISFIIVLGILVFIHELGHYLAARHVGVKVLSFSVGFPPKMWGKKIGDTEYMISWVPLGGYVKLHGQNLDDEDPNDPENYASKSVLQRFYILVAGPLMNLVFALIFMPFVYLIGVTSPQYLSEAPLVGYVESGSRAEQMGLQAGDTIVALNDHSVKTWKELYERTPADDTKSLYLEVLRDGNSLSLEATPELLAAVSTYGIVPHISPVIGGFVSGSAAKQAGLLLGDRLISVNQDPIHMWRDIAILLKKHGQPGQPVQLEFMRNEVLQTMSLIPKYDETSERFLMGITLQQMTTRHGVGESILLGANRLWTITGAVGGFLLKAFSGNGSLDEMGGPVRIAQAVGNAAQSSAAELLFLMSAISLQLGIFNLLPLPVLDGGHIVFLIIEKLRGGVLPAAVRERVQVVGVSLLLGLTVIITYNDILQVFFK